MPEQKNNIELLEKSGFSRLNQGSIFGNVYTILIIVFIGVCFIGIAIYYYVNKTADKLKILSNSTYNGADSTLYVPIFQENAKTVNDCINICNADLTCDGITYNSKTKACVGTKNGTVRQDASNYSAWVKPKTALKSDIKRNFSKAVLVGYTKTSKNIDTQTIQNPYMIGYFCYSFNLTIYDFYNNYGNWRHIFHKGTEIATGSVLTYQSWENLVLDFPLQSIGVWLAPFTNNLRIAVTTTSLGNRNKDTYAHAFVDKCNSDGICYITDTPGGKWSHREKVGDGSTEKLKINTYVEYFDHDLQNIPINKQVNITINFRGRDVEIYLNGKIVKIARLDGVAVTNKSSLYVMNDKTFNGEINNLLMYPDVVKMQDIQDIMALAPVSTI